MATLPQGAGFASAIQSVNQPTNTFIIDWTSKQIAKLDSGLAAMRQAVEIILQNERFRWQIYGSNFGSELSDLPGEEADYIIGDFPRRIEEAFSVDNRILGVENYFFQTTGDSMTISFDVITVFGTVSEEVTI